MYVLSCLFLLQLKQFFASLRITNPSNKTSETSPSYDDIIECFLPLNQTLKIWNTDIKSVKCRNSNCLYNCTTAFRKAEPNICKYYFERCLNPIHNLTWWLLNCLKIAFSKKDICIGNLKRTPLLFLIKHANFVIDSSCICKDVYA